MNAFLSLLLRRAAEPSTWAGVAAVVGSVAQAAATKSPEAIGAAVAGVAAMVIPEQRKRDA